MLTLLLALLCLLLVSGCSGAGASAGGNTAGSSGQLTSSSASANFGNVTLGSSGTQSVTLTNTGTASLTVTQVNVTGAGFSVIGLNLPLTLLAGQSMSFTVKFTATTTGPVTGSLLIVSNVPGPPYTITLNANAMPPPAPQVTWNPATVNLGNVPVGSTGSQTVTLTNSGNANLTVTQATVSGTGFGISGLALPLTLTPNQQTAFRVTCSPSAPGPASGSISVMSNAGSSPNSVPLAATGVQPNLTVNPSSISAGNVFVGSSASQTVTLTNTGSSTLNVAQATVTGPGFSIAGRTIPLSIPAGQSSSFGLRFTPLSAGAASGSLSLLSNAPNSPKTVSLSGTGVATAPGLSINPTSLPFGTVNVGSSSSLGLTVTNTGSASLTITQANVSGSGFSTTGITLPLTMPAGQNSSFSVKFAPAVPGNVTGNLLLVSNAPTSPTAIALSGTGQGGSGGSVSHYIYVVLDGQLQIFDADKGHGLVKTVTLSGISSPLGLSVSVATRSLYISYGGYGGSEGNGSLAKYDLMTDTVIWKKNYAHGVDSIAVAPDGNTIYMPAGEASNDPLMYVLDAATGNELGSITVGTSPHNAMMGLDGKQVYLGPRDENFLYGIDTSTNRVIRKVGPLVATNIASGNGVRPFAVNGKQTLSFTTASGFLGFQVSDINTGNVLYTVTQQGFSWDGTGPSTPCHGISLSPDEREVYLIDTVNGYVHVYDVTGLPGSAPQKVASIKMSRVFNTIGWLQHSRDGRFVYVADTGDVIDTATRQTTNSLPLSNALNSSRWYVEVDWSSGVPVFGALSRGGQGYLTQ
ncbi:MAG: choice-of-anchor D domain-containing protein [Acidobacteria bacterium]|nr:choice-of-anchor D domain-containing protein [Acidobacteriota bacterium]